MISDAHLRNAQPQPITYFCPVCGYDRLDAPPAHYTICPSCGTEFGVEDRHRTHAELRAMWVAEGAPWWFDEMPRPADWVSPYVAGPA